MAKSRKTLLEWSSLVEGREQDYTYDVTTDDPRTAPSHNSLRYKRLEPEASTSDERRNIGHHSHFSGSIVVASTVDNTRSDDHIRALTDEDRTMSVPIDDKVEYVTSPTFSFRRLTSRQRWTLGLCTAAMYLAASAFSLLGPFFTTMAQRKGMSQLQIGSVFGIFQIVIFATRSILGRCLGRTSPKFIYVAGIFVGGVCSVLFGVLETCPDGWQFLLMCLLCRSVEALGFSGVLTASFAIASCEFPDHVGLVLWIGESAQGVGYVIGPVFGGALYELGGYALPFFVAGGLIILNGFLIFIFLPGMEATDKGRAVSTWTILRNPLVVMAACTTFCFEIGMYFFEASFAFKIAPFNLSALITGSIFGIVALLYSLTSTIWGYLADTRDIQGPLIVVGQLVYGFGYLILGGSLILPFIQHKFWTFCLGSAIIGSAFGCGIIPTMTCMVKGATERGFDNDIETYAMVSCLFNSVQMLAGFVGPTGFGGLVEIIGLSNTYALVALLNISMSVICFLYFTCRRLCSSS